MRQDCCLPCFGFENNSFNPDNIAGIHILAEQGKIVIAEDAFFDKDLDFAASILDVKKGGLAERADRENPPCNCDFFLRGYERISPGKDIHTVIRGNEPVDERIDILLTQGVDLVIPIPDEFRAFEHGRFPFPDGAGMT